MFDSLDSLNILAIRSSYHLTQCGVSVSNALGKRSTTRHHCLDKTRWNIYLISWTRNCGLMVSLYAHINVHFGDLSTAFVIAAQQSFLLKFRFCSVFSAIPFAIVAGDQDVAR